MYKTVELRVTWHFLLCEGHCSAGAYVNSVVSCQSLPAGEAWTSETSTSFEIVPNLTNKKSSVIFFAETSLWPVDLSRVHSLSSHDAVTRHHPTWICNVGVTSCQTRRLAACTRAVDVVRGTSDITIELIKCSVFEVVRNSFESMHVCPSYSAFH